MVHVLAAAAVAAVALSSVRASPTARAADPCAVIGTQKWSDPAAVRACFKSVPLDEKARTNILDVLEKTYAFHTSVNYQRLAPVPFTLDVHEDILGDIARIRKQKYTSEYDFHVDLYRSVKRLQDGHASYLNYCYDSLFASYVPIPLVVLDDGVLGYSTIHIAPEAAVVAAAEFPDQINYWQQKAGVNISTIAGAKVVAINDKDPWEAVNANAAIAGSYQAFGTRQIGFFSSYTRAATGWTYGLGQFAAQSLPLDDSVKVTVQLAGSSKTQSYTFPYRARYTYPAFNSTATWRAANCVALESSNGYSYYDKVSDVASLAAVSSKKIAISRQQKLINAIKEDVSLALDIALPPQLTPGTPVSGSGVAQFYQLTDKSVGVLMLGSFSATSYEGLHQTLLDGLVALKNAGVTKLIVDTTNNGGGYICVAHFLHRIIVGPKSTTYPNAGLDTETRAGPLAKQIVKKILAGADPNVQLLYNPLGWAFTNGTNMPANYDWLDPSVKKVINLKSDDFSKRMMDQCQPFVVEPPAAALFDPKKVAIVNNGRCASSCALFSINMVKKEGSKAYVIGGNSLVPQQYTGTVGGQSTDYTTIASEIKSVGLWNSSLAPPDFITNSYMGITWRLGFGVDKPEEPEEWQNHGATRLGWTKETINNPTALWESLSKKLF